MLLSGLALDIGTADTGPFPIDKKEKRDICASLRAATFSHSWLLDPQVILLIVGRERELQETREPKDRRQPERDFLMDRVTSRDRQREIFQWIEDIEEEEERRRREDVRDFYK